MSLKQILLIGTLSGIVGLAGCSDSYYDSRFSFSDRQRLDIELNVSSETANKYDERFDGDDVMSFIEGGFSSKGVNAYAEAFDNSYVSNFRYTSEVVRSFFKNNISPRRILELNDKDFTLDQYSGIFKPIDLFPLIESGISPDEANKYAVLNERYGVKISGFDIVKYKENGFFYEQVAEQARDSWLSGSIER